jgi:hypothetical protein
LNIRFVEGGFFSSFAAGRMGRGWKLPPQLGQTPFSLLSAQSAQKVHSYVQICADARLAAFGRQVAVAALAVGAQFQHGGILAAGRLLAKCVRHRSAMRKYRGLTRNYGRL